eukprot:6153140-Amphidinium_carterae.1
MQNFAALEELLPHEALYGELISLTDEDESEFDSVLVHFVSHEWLGYLHPDPDGVQLRHMQEIFRKFQEGNARCLFDEATWDHFLQGAPRDEADLRAFEQELAFRRQFEEDELPHHVAQGCVWMDYHSIPQATRGATFLAAVNSILHYVERCDYFWVCAPPTVHRDTHERKDFATWRNRGWCRLEETTNLLSRTLKMPLIITNTSNIVTL